MLGLVPAHWWVWQSPGASVGPLVGGAGSWGLWWVGLSPWRLEAQEGPVVACLLVGEAVFPPG